MTTILTGFENGKQIYAIKKVYGGVNPTKFIIEVLPTKEIKRELKKQCSEWGKTKKGQNIDFKI